MAAYGLAVGSITLQEQAQCLHVAPANTVQGNSTWCLKALLPTPAEQPLGRQQLAVQKWALPGYPAVCCCSAPPPHSGYGPWQAG